MRRELSQSIQKARSATNQAGFSLVEVILASAVFVLLVTALVGAYLYGQESTVLAGNRARAVLLAEEGLEAVRNIRDENFSNLTDGIYGLTTTNNQWNLSGLQDIIDIFTRQITISTVDTKRKNATINVSWQQNPQRSGSVSATTYFTNWTAATGGGQPPTTCNEYCGSLGYLGGTCRRGVSRCNANGETAESGGNPLCIQQEGGTCCCAP